MDFVFPELHICRCEWRQKFEMNEGALITDVASTVNNLSFTFPPLYIQLLSNYNTNTKSPREEP